MTDIVREANEGVDIHEGVTGQFATFTEEIKRKPKRAVVGVVILIVGLMIPEIEHELGFLLNVIIAVYGVAMIPFSEPHTKETTKEIKTARLF